jgi:hypothetical protein
LHLQLIEQPAAAFNRRAETIAFHFGNRQFEMFGAGGTSFHLAMRLLFRAEAVRSASVTEGIGSGTGTIQPRSHRNGYEKFAGHRSIRRRRYEPRGKPSYERSFNRSSAADRGDHRTGSTPPVVFGAQASDRRREPGDRYNAGGSKRLILLCHKMLYGSTTYVYE